MDSRPPRELSTTGLEVDPLRAAFRTLAENVETGVVLLDARGAPTYANGAARDLLRAPPTPDDGSDQSLSLPLELQNTPPSARQIDLDLTHPDEPRPWRVRATCIPFPGEESGGLLLLEDLGRADAARSSLELASRLRTWSLFRVVHSLKQPLNVLSLQLELLKQPLDARPDGPSLEQHVTRAQDEVLRFGRELDLLAGLLAPPDSSAPTSFDVGPFLADLTRRIGSALQVARVRLEKTLPEGPLEVRASRARVQQALLEVVQNALHASPRGGVLRLGARASEDGVVIDVEDGGPGMPPAVRARAFDVHFTTRPGATGIGLTVARTLVQSDGGRIELVSRPDGGTLVQITLPKG